MTAYILKGACAILILVVVFLLGMRFIDLRTIDSLTSRNEELSAALLAIDLKAKQETQTYERNLYAIQTKAKRDRAAVYSYYHGLLDKAANNSGAGQAANGAESVDGTAGQQTIARCDIEIERRCVEDALRVQETTEFFRVNNFPTE